MSALTSRSPTASASYADRVPSELWQAAASEEWRELAALVRKIAPDVVVLVGRKTTRFAELMELDFGYAICVADMALAFAETKIILSNARVVIVDDFVNAGSTIAHAVRLVRDAGAIDVDVCVLAQTGHARYLPPETPVHFTIAGRVDSRTAVKLSTAVPEALRFLPKPYSLDFPVVPFSWRRMCNAFGGPLPFLLSLWGPNDIVDHSDPQARRAGITRFTVSLATGPTSYLEKLRFYFDAVSLTGVVMPMPPQAQVWSPTSIGLERVNSVDGVARAEFFRRGLELARRWSERLAVLEFDHATLFDPVDAALTFGPSFALRIAEDMPALVTTIDVAPSMFDHLRLVDSDRAPIEALVDRAQNLYPFPSVEGLFLAVFDALAEMTGETEVESFAFAAPYSPDDIADDPYKRLTIGLTSADLVAVAELVADRLGEPHPDRATISIWVDHFVDAGALVPMICAVPRNNLLRVYRKGERKLRRRQTLNVLNVLDSNSELQLSRTRASKIFAILGYSGNGADFFTPVAEERGVVLGSVPTLPGATQVEELMRLQRVGLVRWPGKG